MGLVTKLVKYGIILAVGYYLGSGCAYRPYKDFVKISNLEKEVVKYEKEISQSQGTQTRFFH